VARVETLSVDDKLKYPIVSSEKTVSEPRIRKPLKGYLKTHENGLLAQAKHHQVFVHVGISYLQGVDVSAVQLKSQRFVEALGGPVVAGYGQVDEL